jgi:hypothetical protein
MISSRTSTRWRTGTEVPDHPGLRPGLQGPTTGAPGEVPRQGVPAVPRLRRARRGGGGRSVAALVAGQARGRGARSLGDDLELERARRARYVGMGRDRRRAGDPLAAGRAACDLQEPVGLRISPGFEAVPCGGLTVYKRACFLWGLTRLPIYAYSGLVCLSCVGAAGCLDIGWVWVLPCWCGFHGTVLGAGRGISIAL